MGMFCVQKHKHGAGGMKRLLQSSRYDCMSDEVMREMAVAVEKTAYKKLWMR